MKKLKFILASFGIMCLFLLIPVVSATTSNVWFDDSTEIVWKFTEEALDESLIVTGTNVTYRKLNFTEVVGNGDHMNITGDIYSATEANVTTFNYTDQTIWEDLFPSLESFEFDIQDADIITKFYSLFNEQAIDMQQIETLPAENQTLVMMHMVVLLDPSFFAAYFLYALAHAFSATFGHDLNGSTITEIGTREIKYELLLDFSIDDSGHWNTMTYEADVDLTYGKDSNILLEGISLSTLIMTQWNSTAYESQTFRRRYTHEIKYPDALVNDYPTPDPDPDPKDIPSYPLWILMGAMVLGITTSYHGAKRKKN